MNNEDQILSIRKISSYNASTENEFKRLSYKNSIFMDCIIKLNGENVEVSYLKKDLQHFDEIKDDSISDKLKFLMNLKNIENSIEDYSININPKNIYFDYNFCIKIIERDIKEEGSSSNLEDFIMQYKSLIGYVLQDKYTYEDYYNGGIDLLNKNKFLKQINECESIENIVEILSDRYLSEKKDYVDNKIAIEKSTYKKQNIMLKIFCIVIILLITYSSIITFKELPHNRKLLVASNAFIRDDYEGVIDSLSTVKLENLPKESKYILSYAYVNSESLAASQKKNILNSITLQSDDSILEFWIHLGKLDYSSTIDIAKRLGDNELLMYSLIKKEQQIMNNSNLTGEEKQQELDTIKTEIEKTAKLLEAIQKEETPIEVVN